MTSASDVPTQKYTVTDSKNEADMVSDDNGDFEL